jgi:hypothetical protein
MTKPLKQKDEPVSTFSFLLSPAREHKCQNIPKVHDMTPVYSTGLSSLR